MKDVEHAGSRALSAVFIFYLALVALLTLAPPPLSQSNGLSGINLVPLIPSIQCFVPDPGQPPTANFCYRIMLGNVVLFVPFGVLLPLVSARRITIGVLVITTVAASVAIEALQYAGTLLGSPRWSDIDDVLLNLVGAIAGYAILLVAQQILRSVRPPAELG